MMSPKTPTRVNQMKVQIEEQFYEVANLGGDARLRCFDEHGINQTTRREVETVLAFDLASCISFERDIDQVATGA